MFFKPSSRWNSRICVSNARFSDAAPLLARARRSERALRRQPPAAEHLVAGHAMPTRDLRHGRAKKVGLSTMRTFSSAD